MQTITGAKMPEGMRPKVATYGGALVGLLLLLYCDFALIWPTSMALAAFFLGRRVLTGNRRLILAPVAVSIGHIGWMLAGAMYVGDWSSVKFYVIVLTVIVAWLLIAPTMLPLIVLALFQVGVLLVNLNTIASYEFGTPMHAVLTAHIVMKLVCLYCVYLSVLSLKDATPPLATATIAPQSAP